MIIDREAADWLKRAIRHNSHDLGEFGRMIRVSYAHNQIDDLLRQVETSPNPLGRNN